MKEELAWRIAAHLAAAIKGGSVAMGERVAADVIDALEEERPRRSGRRGKVLGDPPSGGVELPEAPRGRSRSLYGERHDAIGPLPPVDPLADLTSQERVQHARLYRASFEPELAAYYRRAYGNTARMEIDFWNRAAEEVREHRWRAKIEQVQRERPRGRVETGWPGHNTRAGRRRRW